MDFAKTFLTNNGGEFSNVKYSEMVEFASVEYGEMVKFTAQDITRWLNYYCLLGRLFY